MYRKKHQGCHRQRKYPFEDHPRGTVGLANHMNNQPNYQRGQDHYDERAVNEFFVQMHSLNLTRHIKETHDCCTVASSITPPPFPSHLLRLVEDDTVAVRGYR